MAAWNSKLIRVIGPAHIDLDLTCALDIKPFRGVSAKPLTTSLNTPSFPSKPVDICEEAYVSEEWRVQSAFMTH